MNDVTLNILEEMVDHRMRQPIVLSEFLANYKQALEADVMPKTQHDIKFAMQLDAEPARFDSVLEKCSLKQLMQPDEASIVEFIPGQPETQRIQPAESTADANHLATFNCLRQNKMSNTRNPFRRTSETYKLVPLPREIVADKEAEIDNELTCDYFNDLLLSIRIYRPSRATHLNRDLEKPVFAECFQCLGTNFLTELRDKISCICNKHHFYDISDAPEETQVPEKQTDPGFLFIGDTFYNDKRNAENADYSDVLMNWSKQAKGMQAAKFKKAKMEETRFLDLTISLGFPQLYQHHGNCEHLFTFSQVELLTPSLSFGKRVPRNFYPRLHSFGVFNNRLCNMCGSAHFVYIVEHSDRQLHDPAYLCSRCFISFHYVDGKKIGSFKAYRIQDYNEPAAVLLNEAREHFLANAATESSDSVDAVMEIDEEPEEEEVVTVKESRQASQSKSVMKNADNHYRVVIQANNIDVQLVKEEQSKCD